MKRCASVATAILLLLCSSQLSRAADDTYYPYQMYEEYYQQEDAPPPPPPGNGKQQPPPATERLPRAKQPGATPTAPEFLFPRELGFGVAIGVPYDMFYLSGLYYLIQEGNWHRSSSYRGPWKVVPKDQLPPELLRHDLPRVRQLRNREFRKMWESRDQYQGRRFRPEEKPKQKEADAPKGPN